MRRSPGRTLLAILAIALGVALGLAIYLINRSAADEISLAARSLYGLADLAIEGGGEGFDENLYPRIARVPGVAVASPGRRSRSEAGRPSRRVDVDRAGWISLATVATGFRRAVGCRRGRDLATTRTKMSVESGDFDDRAHTAQRQRRARIAAAAAATPSSFRSACSESDCGCRVCCRQRRCRILRGVVDIATAQWMFGRLGKLSRINLRLASWLRAPSKFATALADILPPVSASDDAGRSDRRRLAAVACVSIQSHRAGAGRVVHRRLLCLFDAVARGFARRREFAVMHAIGVTRTEQLLLMLSGSVIVGVLGAAIGIVARCHHRESRVECARCGPRRGILSWLGAGVECACRGDRGVLAAWHWLSPMAGALRPALDAARVPTASALKAGDITSGEIHPHGWTVLMLARAGRRSRCCCRRLRDCRCRGSSPSRCCSLAAWSRCRRSCALCSRHAPRLRRIPYEIAIAQIAGTARYATLSVSSIIVSFSLMASMAIMVTSFRDSLDQWTQKVLPADLYVRVGYVGQSSYLDEALAQSMARLPGVERVEYSRFGRVQLAADRPALTLIARTLDRDHPDRSVVDDEHRCRATFASGFAARLDQRGGGGFVRAQARRRSQVRTRRQAGRRVGARRMA